MSKTFKVTKEDWKTFGDNTVSSMLNAVQGLANIFGAGSAAESLIRKLTNNPGLIPKSHEIESAIMSDLSKVKALSNAKLTKLQNYLNSPTFSKSNIQRDAIDEFNKMIKKKILETQANVGLADDLMNNALNTASSIDYAVSGEKRKVATQAQEMASKAKQMYDKVVDNDNDLKSVENTI